MAVVSVAAASNVYAAGSASITRIVRPGTNQVVGNGGVRVRVESRASLSSLHMFVNGHNVKGYFRRVGSGFQATLRRGHGLQPGVDELIVTTGASTDFDSVTFVVAQPVSRLLEQTRVRIGDDQTPVQVSTNLAPGSELQAWVNGHRDDGAFHAQGAMYVGRLGANDWLRPGRNRVVLLAYRTSASGRSATYTMRARTFRQKAGQFTAGAGRDLVVNAGQFVRLDGTATDLGQGLRQARHVRFRWRITHRPSGRPPVLDAPDSGSPGFEASVPGTYLVTTSTTGANGATSQDTVTVTARVDMPPIGTLLQTVADDRGTIELGGKPVQYTGANCDPGPGGNACARVSYAVFNRVTMELADSGNVAANATGISSLITLAARYKAAPTYLMVVNMQGAAGVSLADARTLFDALGVAKLSDADLQKTFASRVPVSIVGVPGSPAGSAFISNNFLNCDCTPARHEADMSGYVRLNPLSTTGYFEFVFADQVQFDTDASTVPGQIAIKVGAQTYSHAVPTDGSSGFFMVRLNSRTLAVDRQSLYVTNKPDGTEDPAASQQLADDIAAASATRGRSGELLVLLQAFGKPKGKSKAWLAAAAAIGRLGGNAQVFAQLNQKTTDEPYEGRYALAARAAMDTAAAESSQALTNHPGDGRLDGLLGRARDDQYEPLAADPSGTINFDLVRIVNRPSPPGGGFPVLTPGETAAATFLGRDPDIIGVCDPQAPTCDVRRAYYENLAGTDWSNILTRLQGNATTEACAKGGDGFTAADCEDVRAEFEKEIGRRNTVAAYFGSNGLQAPFLGGVQVAALVDVAKIAEQIRQAVQPPAANNATSGALTIISYVVRIGGLAGAVYPPAGAVAGALSGAFSLAAYLTRQDGSPDLIGPRVSAAAVNLGSQLYERYQRASAYFTTEAKIIMSDWSKMSDVAAVATSSPRWKLGDIATTTENIRLATKQAIYQALVPVAYPVLYDLGTGITDARSWICRSPSALLYDKKLFQRTAPGAQLSWTITDGPSAGETHLLAVGGRHTVGSLHSAYVPAPPDSVTGPLFRDPSSDGGIGLNKLEFYSPQNFQLFGKVLQQSKPTDPDRDYGYGYYTCQSMPDPPGNSG